ncbi:MAG: DNA alkylation repair protein [Clostridia bacterium]|nr:DNA alkylation repair protein [Clostridia bacterium]
MEQEIRNKLFQMQDLKYKEFNSDLCPNVDNIIGVRIPDLRKYAKELYKNNKLNEIKIEDHYYEELMLQGMIIGFQIKENIENVIQQIKQFVPKINSWAVCDTFSAGLKITKKYPKEMFEVVKLYLKSKKEYELRFSIVMLLDYYINDEYIDEVLEILGNVESDKYYVQMANAWAISECLVKYYEKTKTFLKNTSLDKFTHNKAIQKAIESYRITDDKKQELRKMKI